MKFVLLLLLVTVLCVSDSDAWGRRRWVRFRGRRIIRFVGRALPYVPFVLPYVGKREIESHDLNNDGFIDQSEAEKIFETRDAEDMLSMADADGDSKVSLAEWQSNLENMLRLAERDVDTLRDSFEDDNE